MSKQQETKFKELFVKELLQIANTWYIKTQEVGRRGTPDYILCICEYFIALELKTDTGVVSKLQEYNIQKISNAGGIALVVTPSNFIKVIKLLKQLSHGGEHDKIKIQLAKLSGI